MSLDLPEDKFDMVDVFVVDIMHAFLQNTTRKFIYAMQEPCKTPNNGRIMPSPFAAMDAVWMTFKFPVEFARPVPQSLQIYRLDRVGTGIETFKATQLRNFALYGSCMLLKGHANRETVILWRHLVFAMRILCDKKLCTIPDMNYMAEDLIISFQQKLIQQFPRSVK